MTHHDRDRRRTFRNEVGLRAHFIATTAGELRDELKYGGDNALTAAAAWRLLSITSLVDAGVRDMGAHAPVDFGDRQRERLDAARTALTEAERHLREFHDAERHRADAATIGEAHA